MALTSSPIFFLTLHRYAAVAFGVPTSIDDSDVQVSEIDDLASVAGTTQRISPDTCHKLKSRLYRIMGPFLGRRRQTNQLERPSEIHAKLKAWHDQVPPELRYDQFSAAAGNQQPVLIRMQAVALQLAYANLQIVLHRRAIHPQRDSSIPSNQRQESLGQLFSSAVHTADATAFDVTERMCRSSHAAMHVGICSFSAGVVLSALLVEREHVVASEEAQNKALRSLESIIALFERFPGQQYRLATQSLAILKALRSKIDSNTHNQASSMSQEAESQHSGMLSLFFSMFNINICTHQPPC
jgi:hypothetical protein